MTVFSVQVKKTIGKQYGATGMTVDSQRDNLYVALAAGDALSVIDLHTLKEIARHDTGPRTCPTHLARIGDNVWFGHGCDDNWTGGVGPLDTAVYTASRSTNDFPAYETTALAGRGAYRVGCYPVAVSVSPDDQYIALGIQNPDNDVVSYEPGGVLPVQRLDITEDVVALRGLARARYTSRLFVITMGATGGSPALRIIEL
ncbi:hypothetical protein GCM10022629_62360 [Amorphoplanes auranticolor]